MNDVSDLPTHRDLPNLLQQFASDREAFQSCIGRIGELEGRVDDQAGLVEQARQELEALMERGEDKFREVEANATALRRDLEAWRDDVQTELNRHKSEQTALLEAEMKTLRDQDGERRQWLEQQVGEQNARMETQRGRLSELTSTVEDQVRPTLRRQGEEVERLGRELKQEHADRQSALTSLDQSLSARLDNLEKTIHEETAKRQAELGNLSGLLANQREEWERAIKAQRNWLIGLSVLGIGLLAVVVFLLLRGH